MVFDFTRVFGGPFGTAILRDLGAGVIKFEPPAGDSARMSGPFREGDSAYFHPQNRGKESVVVDLRDREQVQRVKHLLPRADCLVEAFRPGVMDAIGLGAKECMDVNPSLVYASLSGFGADGPYASRRAFDVVIQAMGGVMSVTGHDGGPPTRVGVSQADVLSGIYTALAVLSALVRRSVTGTGARLDVSMLEAQMALATHAFGIYEATGEEPGRIGNRHPVAAPFGVYPTADGYVAIAGSGESFPRLCQALGLDELAADRRFATEEARLDHVAELTEAITSATTPLATSDVIDKVLAYSVACGPVLGIKELLGDPHVEVRRAMQQVTPWGGGTLPVPGLPFTIDDQRVTNENRAPELDSLGLDGLERELNR